MAANDENPLKLIFGGREILNTLRDHPKTILRIAKAIRKELQRVIHPDVNGGDLKLEELSARLNKAVDLLEDSKDTQSWVKKFLKSTDKNVGRLLREKKTLEATIQRLAADLDSKEKERLKAIEERGLILKRLTRIERNSALYMGALHTSQMNLSSLVGKTLVIENQEETRHYQVMAGLFIGQFDVGTTIEQITGGKANLVETTNCLLGQPLFKADVSSMFMSNSNYSYLFVQVLEKGKMVCFGDRPGVDAKKGKQTHVLFPGLLKEVYDSKGATIG